MSTTKKKKPQESSEGLKEGLGSYFKGVKNEWTKVTWPERKQVIVETIVVLGVVFFFTALIYVIDITFKGILDFIPNR